MDKTTKEERLQKLDKKMAQLKAQRQAIVSREKQKERKERTRRLIQIGALSEKYFRSTDISPAEFESLAKEIVALPGFDSLFTHNENGE